MEFQYTIFMQGGDKPLLRPLYNPHATLNLRGHPAAHSSKQEEQKRCEQVAMTGFHNTCVQMGQQKMSSSVSVSCSARTRRTSAGAEVVFSRVGGSVSGVFGPRGRVIEAGGTTLRKDTVLRLHASRRSENARHQRCDLDKGHSETHHALSPLLV